MGRFVLINKKYSAGLWVVFTIQYLNKLEMESRSSGNIPLTKYQMFIASFSWLNLVIQYKDVHVLHICSPTVQSLCDSLVLDTSKLAFCHHRVVFIEPIMMTRQAFAILERKPQQLDDPPVSKPWRQWEERTPL